MKKIIIMLAFILALMLITGCSDSMDTSGDVGIKGLITSISSSEDPADIRVALLVEGTVEDNLGLVSDKASVSLTKKTVLIIPQPKGDPSVSRLDSAKKTSGIESADSHFGPALKTSFLLGFATNKDKVYLLLCR